MAKGDDSDSRPLTARGAATRSRIVTAAAELIYARGVNGTSLDDVMAKSGVSKSQLYHYFADKDALVLEVITLQTERVMSAQQPQLDAIDSLKALRVWRDAFVQLNKHIGYQGCPLGSLASELANDSEAARKRLAASFAIWRDVIEQGLAKMRERGALSPSSHPRELAIALLSAVEGGLLLSKTTQTSRPFELAIDMAIEHIARHMNPASRRSRRKRH